jgi:hypothetical protein
MAEQGRQPGGGWRWALTMLSQRLRWPLVTRTVHDMALHACEQRQSFLAAMLAEAETRETYWRERCERLTDAALARVGAIHEPTMQQRPPPPKSLIETAMAGLAIREIDSARP